MIQVRGNLPEVWDRTPHITRTRPVVIEVNRKRHGVALLCHDHAVRSVTGDLPGQSSFLVPVFPETGCAFESAVRCIHLQSRAFSLIVPNPERNHLLASV